MNTIIVDEEVLSYSDDIAFYYNKLFTGIVRVCYEDGSIRNTTEYQQGKKFGSSKTYYENGNLMQSCQFIDNKLIGVLTNYFQSGNIISLEFYHEGQCVEKLSCKDFEKNY